MSTVKRKFALTISLIIVFSGFYCSLSYRNNYETIKYLVADWFLQSDAQNVAYGSSTIANYKFLENKCGKWVKRGFNNARVSDFLNYLVLQPKNENIKNVVVYLGENDLAEKQTVKDVSIKYDQLLEHLIILYPNSVFHVLGLKMSPARQEFWPSFHMLNDHLRRISERKTRIVYHSMETLNSFSEKVFLSDGVHLNQSGYKLIFTGVYSECKK